MVQQLGAGHPEQTLPPEAAEIVPEWEVVGQFGIVRTVYVSPNGLRDKSFVLQVLRIVTDKYEKSKPIQVMFFDDKRNTPKRLPMTDPEMLHWKAQYNRNPNTNYERFVWISVTDPKSSPPKVKETEEEIGPVYSD